MCYETDLDTGIKHSRHYQRVINNTTRKVVFDVCKSRRFQDLDKKT